MSLNFHPIGYEGGHVQLWLSRCWGLKNPQVPHPLHATLFTGVTCVLLFQQFPILMSCPLVPCPCFSSPLLISMSYSSSSTPDMDLLTPGDIQAFIALVTVLLAQVGLGYHGWPNLGTLIGSVPRTCCFTDGNVLLCWSAFYFSLCLMLFFFPLHWQLR